MKVSIPCICPGKKHQQDSVTLRDKLDFRTAIALRNSVAVAVVEGGALPLGDVMAVLTEAYLTHCIESWTLRGKDGPIPVNVPAIREHLLSNIDVAETIGDAADDLYQETVMLPLLRKASNFSPVTPTDESTSQTTEPSTKRPKRSKHSSITTIPTAATEMTSVSLDGDSSLSPSSASAA